MAEKPFADSLLDIQPRLEQEGLALSVEQARKIEHFGELVARWNHRINLTGERERFYSRHVLDALMLEKAGWPSEACNGMDIGSGAGLPGLIVALRHPKCRITSVDSSAKKISFQQVAQAELELPNFFPLRGDIHQIADSEEGTGCWDVVTARAFAPLGVLLKLAGKLLRPGGRLVAMKGARLPEEQALLDPESLQVFEGNPEIFSYDFADLKMGGTVVVYLKKSEKD